MFYAFGLGYTKPPVSAGQAPIAPAPTVLPISVAFDARQNALAARPPVGPGSTISSVVPRFSGLIPNYVGLYQINVIVPPSPAGSLPCTTGGLRYNGIQIESNLTIDVGGPASFDGIGICVDPAS